MTHSTRNTAPPNEKATRIDIEGGGWRVFASGPALAVIAIVAVIGLILISLKLTELGVRAIDTRRPAVLQPDRIGK